VSDSEANVAPTIETHYDILKVVRNAPVDVIKASYRVMSQKYHPDRNPDPNALEIMTRINQAWDVLRDPERRANHDRWIARQEVASAPPAAARPSAPDPVFRPARNRSARATPAGGRVRRLARRHGIAIAAVVAVATAICLLISYLVAPVAMDDDVVAVSEPASTVGGDTVWLTKPWEAVPAKRLPHGYIDGEEQYYSDGLSTFDINNTGASTDAEVRLYRNGRTVRSMFVHRGQHFIAEKLPAGTYTMKYKIAVDGKMHAWQANTEFQLSQVMGEAGEADSATQAHVTMSGVEGGVHENRGDEKRKRKLGIEFERGQIGDEREGGPGERDQRRVRRADPPRQGREGCAAQEERNDDLEDFHYLVKAMCRAV